MVMLRPSAALLQRAVSQQSNAPKRQLKSVGLSVHFKHPDFGMKDYEILSRATAFLLAVDPPTPSTPIAGSGKYSHLDESEERRKERKVQQSYPYTPAGGPQRHVHELGWLEFCPKEFRPTVHCLASSHVLAPWNWKNYYPHEWLQQVKPEHCTYSLEVFDTQRPYAEALAKFALNPYPIHDDRGLDLAMLHLKQEDGALEHLTDLGVEILHLTDKDKQPSKGDKVHFDGFEIADPPGLDPAEKETMDDTRVFVPFAETGKLLFAASDSERFLASTGRVLPEGLCGGPALDDDGKVCGIVEGVIPPTSEHEMIVGATCFLSIKAIREFLDMAEKYMLQQLIPKTLFRKVDDMKDGNWMVGKEDADEDEAEKKEEVDEHMLDDMWQGMVTQLKKNCSEEEVNAVLSTIRRDADEVLGILEEKGGDMDDVIEEVHGRTMAARQQLMEQLQKDPEERQRIIDEVGALEAGASITPKADEKP